MSVTRSGRFAKNVKRGGHVEVCVTYFMRRTALPLDTVCPVSLISPSQVFSLFVGMVWEKFAYAASMASQTRSTFLPVSADMAMTGA